jgi:AcrR family transcriptional regulator
MVIHISGRSRVSSTRPSNRRRSEILEAAAEVIAERGICETRIADVGKRAGMSAALVLYYFDSKDRLLTEALTFAEDRFYLSAFHDLSSMPSATERLARLIDRSFPARDEGDAGDWKLWIELWSRALRDPEVARKREALDRRWRETIAGVVREGQRTGEFADVDADAFALRFASLMDGLAIQAVLADPEGGADRVRDVCMEMAARELGFEPALSGDRPGGRK